MLAPLLALALALHALLRTAHPVLAQCSTAATSGPQARGGACVYYAGGCSPVVGNWVWLPTNWTLAVMERRAAEGVAETLQQADSVEALSGQQCLYDSETLNCDLQFFPCFNHTYADGTVEGVPMLPCRQSCVDYWATCRAANQGYYDIFLAGGEIPLSQSLLPQCGGADGGFNDVSLPADVWGGRNTSAVVAWPAGYTGELEFPPAGAPYTLSTGLMLDNVTCYVPAAITASLAFASDDAELCFPPMAQVGQQCALPCPYPIWDAEEIAAIQDALVVPGVLAFALNVLVWLDAALRVWRAVVAPRLRGARLPKLPFSSRLRSTGDAPSSSAVAGAVVVIASPTSSTSPVMVVASPASATSEASALRTGPMDSRSPARFEAEARPRRRLNVMTMYGLAGSSLSIVYFAIGVAPVLAAGAQVSCDESDPYIQNSDIIEGTADRSDAACRAQRLAPFIVQLVLNTTLFALLQACLLVSVWARGAHMRNRRVALQCAAGAFCFAYPLCCLVAAASLDTLSNSPPIAQQQLARSAAVCSLRLDADVQFVLVSLPLILSGAGVVLASAYTFVAVNETLRRTAGLKHGVAPSAGDAEIHSFVFRIRVLGLLTFAVTIVYMVCASVSTEQILAWAPYFFDFFTCESLDEDCGGCPAIYATALMYEPDVVVEALEFAMLSCVPLLFGVFFSMHAVRARFKGGSRGATGASR